MDSGSEVSCQSLSYEVEKVTSNNGMSCFSTRAQKAEHSRKEKKVKSRKKLDKYI